MKKVLVTGAKGFIGNRLCQKLSEENFEVHGTVRKNFFSNNFLTQKYITVDIGPETDWHEVLQGCEYVIHLAARVHVMRDDADAPLVEFREINTAATLNLAKQAANDGVKRFIYLSSIKVNGEFTLQDKPFTEEDDFIPSDPYALSKYEAEQGLLQIGQKSQMEVVIIRPPLVYGVGVKANFINMMKWVYREIPLPFGLINNKRSLVNLDNLIDLIVTCLDHPAAANEIFLVSDDEDLSTTELLNHVAVALGKKQRLLRVNQKILTFGFSILGKKDLAQRLCGSLQVDISKTKKLLNWVPPVSVDEGLRKTAQHFLKSQKK